jgi:hypothetical protein
MGGFLNLKLPHHRHSIHRLPSFFYYLPVDSPSLPDNGLLLVAIKPRLQFEGVLPVVLHQLGNRDER